MKVGCVPTKYGYSVVCLYPYTGDWELDTPIKLPDDLLIQLRGQILHKLAIYCHELSTWTGQLPLAILWAAFGIAALALCGLWEYGLKYVGLYMWVRFFFFGDGIWLLSRYIAHWRGIRDAKKIREEVVKGQWEPFVLPLPERLPPRTLSERRYLEELRKFSRFEPYVNEMLRVDEPWAFSAAPLGVGGIIQFLLKGVKVPRPALIFDIGTMEGEP